MSELHDKALRRITLEFAATVPAAAFLGAAATGRTPFALGVDIGAAVLVLIGMAAYRRRDLQG